MDMQRRTLLHTGLAALLTVVFLVAAATDGRAQSNSLFRSGLVASGDDQGATNAGQQPSGGAGQLPVPSGYTPAIRPRSNVPTTAEDLPVNHVLLEYSPIAVEVPQPERIKVNDLVSVIIRESKSAKSDSSLKSEKDWEMKSELAKWIRLDDQLKIKPAAFPAGNPAIDFTFENDYEGKGEVDRTDTFTTRVTARVIDVKPNGNLVLEAKKYYEHDEERATVTLTGECRSRDVTAQNTVLSSQLADLEITVEHTGSARDAARRGWLMRLFDFLRPI